MKSIDGLQRFVEAQDPVYSKVCAELVAGRKASHWMWFIFPQLKGLGRSATARHFGINSRDEAVAYWLHPVLGLRLRECTGLVLGLTERKTPYEIFSTPDDMKFHSCMTLFHLVVPEEITFKNVLARFFDHALDPRTLAELS